MPDQVDAAVALERRLTLIESRQTSLEERMEQEVLQVKLHKTEAEGRFILIESYIKDAKEKAKFNSGYDHGATSVRKKDLAILAGICTAAIMLAPVVFKIAEYVLE